MGKSKSDNLSKGDIISFVALLLMGVAVFFGMNFKTLGDKVPSVAVSILLVVIMTVFVFLAAHAKAQNRNQDKWRMVEYTMLGLYFVSLIPCYIYVSKFFDVQFGKTEIMNQAQSDIDGIDRMFTDFNKKCDSRASSYKTYLEALIQDEQGKKQIAEKLGIDASSISTKTIQQASESFLKKFKGADYRTLEAEKKNLENNVQNNFKNWNILFIPQFAAELGSAKQKFATDLQSIYEKHKDAFEKRVPEFDAKSFLSESNIVEYFSRTAGFSILGLLCVLILGGLGLVKYILGEKRTVIDFKEGNASTITEDGGFTF